MTTVREHMSHHERADVVPLITESATVTDVVALDETRFDEVYRAIETILTEIGREDLIVDTNEREVDRDGINTVLKKRDIPFADKLEKLVQRYDREYPSLLSVGAKAEEQEVDFVPGQYLTVRFHDTPRPYSIASSPSTDQIRFCIRRVPGGHLTPELFEELDPGDEITIRGPYGDFVMEEPSSRDMVFLATGTGVAPFRSMIDYTFEEERDIFHGEPRDIWLFLGASWGDDLAYHDHFRDLANRYDNFHYVPTLSRENYLTDWNGETAYVQQTFLKYIHRIGSREIGDELEKYLHAEPKTDVGSRLDPSNVETYACGVNAMVTTLVNVAEQIGISENHIQGEGYG